MVPAGPVAGTRTAGGWAHHGGDLSGEDRAPTGRTAVHARVSSADQKADLDAQVARVTAWATSNGYSVDQAVTEVGSALNGKRRKCLKLLSDPTVSTIIVEHRDRFARFGAEYVAGALDAGNRRVVRVDDAEVDDDLVRDMTELMTSLCARLYGRRSAAHRAAEAAPSKRRSSREKFTISDGWIARGFSFEVTWPTAPEATDRVRSHFGARRFAYNWALGQVKADMDAKAVDPTHESVPWNLYALRKRFNAEKPAVAPWWRENSKEAYATGIADLCSALKNWSESKSGKRKGRKVAFPAFKSRRKDQARVRFSTGAIRVTPDRRTVTLPVVRHLRAKENTRRLERLVGVGKARILSATLTERWGRLFVSFSCIVQAHPYPAPTTGGRAGVDLGLRVLATVADDSGTAVHVPNPAPLRATLKERRRMGRQLSRRIPGSNGHRAAKAKLAHLDRRVVHLRREAHHQLTSWLAGTYREVVIEDLDLAAMKEHGTPGLPAFCVRRCVGCDQAPAHLQDGMERIDPHGRRPLVRLIPDPPRVRLPPDRTEEAGQTARLCRNRRVGRPGHQRSTQSP